MIDAIDIIKALEHCVSVNSCDDCHLPPPRFCTTFETKDFLDLLIRLTAENEILKQARANIFEIANAYERGKKAGAKEFAERLIAIYESDNRYNRPSAHTLIVKLFSNIDNIKKEMVGDKE